MIAQPVKPKGYRRAGLPNITGTQIHVLRYLLECKRREWPFVPLPDVHPHTIRSLLSKDWIFASQGHDGLRYGITSRAGQKLWHSGFTPSARNGAKQAGRVQRLSAFLSRKKNQQHLSAWMIAH